MITPCLSTTECIKVKSVILEKNDHFQTGFPNIVFPTTGQANRFIPFVKLMLCCAGLEVFAGIT